ncbi:MAG: biotin--[acetyl-CoA-carboxylase] ligase, partial [Candidatus Aegiribacteria sp.]|nr:biotin--[acetyl-CoA-carboxylase] ligase [Candidatus Aegiribacteria sp.]MBD3294013.1 biotin--[acetyl-CoA-carboxylase] ligase [Candidatus Fermentibacteria bacterium]
TSGRGRKGRIWISPPGTNLYISLVLRPPVSPAEASQIPILAVIAILRTMMETAPDLSLQIKWPNDVFAGEKKISGTLCEMKAEIDRVDHVIVGVGMNVNMNVPMELKDIATSMKAETSITYSRARLAALLLKKFEDLYAEWLKMGDLSDFQQEWKDHSMLLGKRVDVKTPAKIISGWSAGIDPGGALKLEYPDGRVRFVYAGDASLHDSGPVS